MGKRHPMTSERMGAVAGKIAAAIIEEVEDQRQGEVLDRWDEIKALMPLAFALTIAMREALLQQGYGQRGPAA